MMAAMPILDRLFETSNVDYGDIVEDVEKQLQASKL